MSPEPYLYYVPLDSGKASCGSVYKAKRARCILRDCLNQMLSAWNDLDMLKGGITVPAMLHAMLVHKKKRMIVPPGEYQQLAARLLVNCSITATLFSGVPIATSGVVSELDGSLKVSYLHGQVMIYPIIRWGFTRTFGSCGYSKKEHGKQYE